MKKELKQLKKIKEMVKEKKLRLAAQWPKKYQILIATILSSQTRDEVTIPACETLFKKYPSMKSLSQAKEKEVKKIISRVNFKNTKAKRIIKVAKILAGKKIPNTTEELTALPGVGRKVANVYLAEAIGADKIGVDTHVARISYKLGWTKSKNPHKIEKDLEKLFPRKYWNSINETLVTFGKTYGLSRKKEDEILESLKKIR